MGRGGVREGFYAGVVETARGGLLRAATAYTLARLGLVILLAAVLVAVQVPLLVALLLALLVALPLSLVAFRGLRAHFITELAATAARRRAARARLRAQLRGDPQS